MSDERRLAATGMPLEDAISMCHDLRREGTLKEVIHREEKRACKCGGAGICCGCECSKKGVDR